MARTQQQRREATIAALLDSCIATITEIGYARASAAEITKRAGVSVGALFRHFDTMGDFMAAAAHEVLRRQLEMAEAKFADLPADQPSFERLLGTLCDLTRSPTHAVLYELMIAARTDEKLRTALGGVLDEYSTKIFETVRALPGGKALPPGTLAVLLATLTNIFDGAAIVRSVVPQAEIEAQQIQMLAAVLNRAYAESSGE